MVVPIVHMIGLSLGLLLWGTSNLILGWCSGTFGLFGLTPETVPKPWLNYLGFILAIFSIGIYVFIKSEATSSKDKTEDNENLINYSEEKSIQKLDPNWIDSLSPFQKRIFGIFLSILSGIFYGVNFDPPTYLENHGGSQNGLDYVFSHFCGIYITSTFYFLVYCILKKNKPTLYPQAVLPGIICGGLWSIADICWFVANSKLDLVISFPIITTGPGVIASLWGIFVFGEISGKRNIIILLIAFATTFVAVTMIALSK